MSKTRSYDSIFFSLSMLLLVFGLFILASASLGISVSQFGYPYYYLSHQIVFGILPGLIFLYAAYRAPYALWRTYALPILLLALFLMFLVLLPGVGLYYGGARRWIALGPITFQPAEFLKLAYVIYLAAWLESKSKAIGSFKFGFLPFLIMSAFIASFLVLQPDIGTLVVLLISVLALFFLSGGNFRQMALLSAIGLVIISILIAIAPYRQDRLKVFLNSSHDLQGKGYQINQAMIAVGSGGFWGRGFGLSRQKFSYLPEPIGDSIFAVAAEELGFMGGITLLALFLLFFLRGIWVARQAPDLFGKLLGAGILFLIMFQALINISAIIGLLPLTGIPLSFVSYGGTASVVTLAEVGIILNISKKRL